MMSSPYIPKLVSYNPGSAATHYTYIEPKPLDERKYDCDVMSNVGGNSIIY